MNADPLWQATKKRLEGQIDPALFERCMQDILRDPYPNLTPVVGGSDNGMDGALGSADGPFPLICTTSGDVIGNFKNSITNHLEARGGPRQCVLATSQHLTPQRKDNILQAARELGVNVVNIHDQEDVVGRLYRNSKWRHELLGLPGSPPALSRYPQRMRSVEASLLIGREDDLAWLRSTKGDLLVVGEPGSGKTHIHQHLAANGEALFLVSENETDVANAVRDQAPTVIVVDDAHVNLSKIDFLRRLRQEIGAAFAIHANSWPSEDASVRARLDIDETNVRHLQLLTQRQIRELIDRLGITGPDSILHIIIQQSEGRAGLTSALVEACKRGRVDAVWSGDALANSLLVDRRVVRDEADKTILAAFSLGADPGLPAHDVAGLLELPLTELRERLSSLGTGGIVSETHKGRVTVRPPALRAILVRDIFFKGFARPNFQDFLKLSADMHGTMHVLLNARQRGADVPADFVEEQVANLDGRDLWEHFAWVDEFCARRVLEAHPKKVVEAATGLLHFLPEAAISSLLDSASLASESGANRRNDALAKIGDWVCPMDDFSQVGTRRKQLIGIIQRRVEDGAELGPQVIAACINIAANPGYASHTVPPGAPMTVQIRRGVVPLECLQSIMAEWPALLSLARQVPSHAWKKLVETGRDWLWPSNHTISHPIPADIYDWMRESGKRMIVELASLAECKGIARCELSALARAARLDVRIEGKGLAKVIFREPDLAGDYHTRQLRRERELRLQAAELLPKGAQAVTSELAGIEREAAEFGKTSGGWDRWLLYEELAKNCDDPADWLNKAIAAELPADAVWRFARAVATRRPALLSEFLRQLIGHQAYEYTAIDLILRIPGMPEDLLGQVSEYFQKSKAADSYFLVNAGTTPEAIGMLLNHENKAIRRATALGIWHRSEKKGPPAESQQAWREAVLLVGEDDRESHWLEEIFEKFPDIANEWATARLHDKDRWLWKDRRGMRAAAKVLPAAQRQEMLTALMSHSRYDEECFDAILGHDVELLRDWLRTCKNGHLRLAPLHRTPSPRWQLLANVALSEGISAEEIWAQLKFYPGFWSGPMSTFYQSLFESFIALQSHANPNFHEIGRRGAEIARAELAKEKAKEKREEVTGR